MHIITRVASEDEGTHEKFYRNGEFGEILLLSNNHLCNEVSREKTTETESLFVEALTYQEID